jgi:hypothetical protein
MANTNVQGATGAAEFLKKYSTVVGSHQQVDELLANPQGATGAAEFLEKYSTVVGMPQAINTIINSVETSSVEPDEQGATGTDDAGAGDGTDNQGD